MKKNFKKLFLILAVITTALVCFAVSASALDATGQCGDNVYWEYNSTTGELIISGTGAMWNYITIDFDGSSDSPFPRSNIKSVIIENEVTTIGDYAFKYCGSLTSVTLPNSMTTIGGDAFYGCTNLTSITIPDSITSIGMNAFYDTGYYNDETNWENKALYIGKHFIEAKQDISGSYTIKDGTKTIGNYALSWCDDLTSITIPDSVTAIGNYTFYWCDNLTSITIPNSVTLIGDGAFKWCVNLTNITIGNSVITIGDDAFADCSNFTNITIPDSVVSIGDRAFSDCYKLTSITIPDSVTSIGDDAFYNCSNLTSVYYTGTKAQWEKINIGSCNDELGMAVIHYNCCAHKNTVDIPQQKSTCTSVGYTAGSYCSDCEKWASGHTEIAKISHKYTTYTSDKNATFLADGTKTALCDYGCGNKKTVTDSGSKLSLGKTEKVTATQTTSTVSLSWTAVKGAYGYGIYKKTSTGWKPFATTTKLTYTVNGLTAGTKYTFAVRAYVGEIVVDWSDVYTTFDTATKTAKPKVSAAQSTSAIKLSWPTVKGATGYRIYYKSNGVWKVTVSSTTATSHTFSKLKAGAKYTFAVRPYIKNGSTVVWSDYTEFMTATKPATVTAKTSSPSKGKITLSWNQVNGADGYQIYYKTGNGSYKLYKTVGKTTKSMNFSNLKLGTKYTFVVRAGIKTSGGNIYGAYKASTVTVK